MARVLALDYGTVRIGTAISDEDETWAFPREVIDGRDPERAADLIASLVRDEEVGTIVIGHPLLESGAEGAASAAVKAFSDLLRACVGVPVELLDERRTTVQASELLRDATDHVQKRPGATDSLAAVLLLQTYLERRTHGH